VKQFNNVWDSIKQKGKITSTENRKVEKINNEN
jgi:hypothetical protein